MKISSAKTKVDGSSNAWTDTAVPLPSFSAQNRLEPQVLQKRRSAHSDESKTPTASGLATSMSLHSILRKTPPDHRRQYSQWQACMSGFGIAVKVTAPHRHRPDRRASVIVDPSKSAR